MARYFGFKPYEQNDKYGFISYKSEEDTIVAPYARELNDRGINLWYDEGIPLGSKWDEVISEHIAGASFMFVFVTNKLFISEEIKKEVTAAKNKDIPVIPVLLEDVQVPRNQLLFGETLFGTQGINAYEINDISLVADELCRKLSELGIETDAEREARERRLKEKEDEVKRMEDQRQELSRREQVLKEREAAIREQLESVSNIKIVVDDYYVGKKVNVETDSGIEPRFVITDFLDKTRTDIRIPSQINNLPVYLVGSAFKGFSKLVSLTIEKGVLFSFYDHYDKIDRFSSIAILDDLREIGPCDFSNLRSLKSISLPNTITSIGDYAFNDCHSLETINIPVSVSTIGDGAFQNCHSLQSITIPDSVTAIGDCAFKNCYSLQSITIPDSVTAIGNCAFENCFSLQSITIPDSVTAIGNCAFENCYSLQSITIPDSVTSIGNSAFENCFSLISILLPDSLNSIGMLAFSGCISLLSINIPCEIDGFYNIDVFRNCTSIKDVRFGSKIKTIHSSLLCDITKIESLDIPNGVIRIESGAFKYCYSLRSVSIPESVSEIEGAFYGCKSLSTISVSSQNKHFKVVDGVLFDIDMKTLLCYPPQKNQHSYCVPNSVTTIAYRAFDSCQYLKHLILPDKLESPNPLAIYDCFYLTHINIPSKINGFVFSGCNSLKKISISKDNHNLAIIDNVIFDKQIKRLIWYPITKKDKQYTIPTSVTHIISFQFNKYIKSIILSENVSYISKHAFRGCSSLSNIILRSNSSAYKIDNNVLYNEHGDIQCMPARANLQQLVCSRNVSMVPSFAFSYCKNIKSVSFEYCILLDNSFENCDNLNYVIINDGTTNISANAFVNCPYLKICSYKDSEAKIYAMAHGIPFIEIPEE